jgi:hypothetical protein
LGAEEALVLRIFVRRSDDLSYLEGDRANELDTLRDGPARWEPLGAREGLDPRAALRRGRGAVVGYDLIFAAPRPVSSLVAIGTDAEGAATVAAHRAAVADALGYLERRALVTRRQILGDVDLIAAAWPVALAYTHGINRAGEPHLHDHVVVPARVASRGPALDGRSLFAHALSADALYRSSLRHEIGRMDGRASWRSARGVDHVGGVDEGYRAIWPGRAERGEKRLWSRDEATASWRRDLDRYDEGPRAPAPRARGSTLDEHAFAGAFEGESTIARRDLVRAWADAATRGAPIGSVDAAIDRHYPELSTSRGLDGRTISRNAARQLDVVRQRGPRALVELADHLDGPDRDLSRRWPSRSR